MNENTVWIMWECGGGSRWTSTNRNPLENSEGKVCEFSGCNCGTIVKRIGETSDRNKAGDWFRRQQGYPE